MHKNISIKLCLVPHLPASVLFLRWRWIAFLLIHWTHCRYYVALANVYKCVCCATLYGCMCMSMCALWRNTLTHIHTKTISSVLPGGVSEPDEGIRLSVLIQGSLVLVVSWGKTTQSKVNIWSECSLSHMQLRLYRKGSVGHMLSYMWGCGVKICFMANDILLSQLPVYIPSCPPPSPYLQPPTPGLPGFMGRQTKTCKKTETRVVIWSHLMVREGKGRGVFIQKIGAGCHCPVWGVHTDTQPLPSSL